jgi:hypothetical protein
MAFKIYNSRNFLPLVFFALVGPCVGLLACNVLGVFTPAQKILFSQILARSKMVSRTASGSATPAHSLLLYELDPAVALTRANSNHDATVEWILEYIGNFEIDLNTTARINGKLVHLMVLPNYINRITRRQSPRRLILPQQMDEDFLDDLTVYPYKFYDWLESPETKTMAKSDPVALAEILHNNISALDSFADGNGRTARLMAAIVLMQAGFAPPLYTEEADYLRNATPVSDLPGTELQRREHRRNYFLQAVARGQRAMEAEKIEVP